MDVLAVFIAIVAALVALDVAALRRGVDSRLQPPSDNRRTAGTRWI
jgi:hypothetical protein